MKISKINKEFLDLYYKKKLIASEVDYDNGKVYITDSYRLYIINIEDMALNFQIFKQVSLKQLIDDSNYEDGLITNNLIDGEYTIRTLINKDNTIKVNINDKYLRLFDNPDIKVKGDDKPVLVYEKGELVGLILPIKEY